MPNSGNAFSELLPVVTKTVWQNSQFEGLAGKSTTPTIIMHFFKCYMAKLVFKFIGAILLKCCLGVSKIFAKFKSFQNFEKNI